MDLCLPLTQPELFFRRSQNLSRAKLTAPHQSQISNIHRRSLPPSSWATGFKSQMFRHTLRGLCAEADASVHRPLLYVLVPASHSVVITISALSQPGAVNLARTSPVTSRLRTTAMTRPSQVEQTGD